VLLDINLPDGDGVSVAGEFEATVLLVSTHDGSVIGDSTQAFLTKADLASPRLLELLGPP
jgi:hypothetical protein